MPYIKVYKGFGSPTQVHIMGHLFQGSGDFDFPITSNPWKNAWYMIKRFTVSTIANTQVQLALSDGTTIETTTNENGFFHFNIEGVFQIQLIGNISASGCNTIEIKIPIKTPKQVLISDIDDTILVSHSTNFLKKIHTLLSKNSRARVPFTNTVDFFNQWNLNEENQVIYVSSSEWNLYDFLIDFIVFNKLPLAPMLLQDLKSGAKDLLFSGSGTHLHKFQKLVIIADTYKESKLILIGDSGQMDLDIYYRFAVEHPHLIDGIYIRNVKRNSNKIKRYRSRFEELGIGLTQLN